MNLRFRLTIIAIAGLCMLPGTAHAAPGIPWTSSLSSALSEARKSNKLIMIDFYTSWCGWCKKLDSDTYPDAKVVQAANQVIPVKLDAEKDGLAAAKKYHVTAFPMILFINGNGEVEGKIGGYEPPADFIQSLNGIVKLHLDVPKMVSRLQSNPNDVDTAAKLTMIYAGRANSDSAMVMLTKVEKLDADNSKGFRNRSMVAVASMYGQTGKFKQAVSLFQEAAKSAKNPLDKGAAHWGLAICYAQQDKLDAAATEFKAVKSIANGPQDMKDAADKMLERIKEFKKKIKK